MRSRPRSLRDIAIENNAADRYYAASFGKEAQFQAQIKPKRAASVPDPNAPPLERDVLKAVWKYLAHHPRVAWVTRINSGTVMADFGADGVHPLRMNYKRGISDLIGMMKTGAFLAVEVKRQGASLMPHQRDFLNEVRRNNGVAFVARAVEDVEQNIDAPLCWPLP